MWQDTDLTRRLGIEVPIIQGPFGGGLSSADLAATVSEAGGLGSFGAHHLAPDRIVATAADIRARTDRPFALNLWIPHQGSDDPEIGDEAFERTASLLKPYYDELGIDLPRRPDRFWPRFDDQIEALLAARPAAFSFVYGVPSAEILDRCLALGIVTIGTATTGAEAVALETAGVDMVVATGFEAGGHRVSFLREPEDCLTGTMALVPQVASAVNIPVIAAGGIADGRGVAAALTLGAQGVQVGTAFLACDQTAASTIHRDALFGPDAGSTTLTKVFTGRLARGIRNRFTDELEGEQNALPPYPIQAWFTGPVKTAAVAQERPELISLWAGQAAPLLRHRDAKTLMTSLVQETTNILCEGR